ncbi:hypothetical protein [Methanospirillum lacunae]|uniref:Uncharacterized protein n=1 Tax=Methanospirillum lacunae TaxID=668570 RepID=A0A2V2N1R3_9EURY|nr:hypothetical protein [Methanospirillum lacunae]PWR71636.1 hypothetical protein DK846_12355 [Methanospirillum lacunae]
MDSIRYFLVCISILVIASIGITNGNEVVGLIENATNHSSQVSWLNTMNASNNTFQESDGLYVNNTSSETLLDNNTIDKRVTGPGLPPPGWEKDANLPNQSDNSTKII